MLTIILLVIAVAGTFYSYITPDAPLHTFLHPAHYTPGVILGQVAFSLLVWGVCAYLGKKIRFLD